MNNKLYNKKGLTFKGAFAVVVFAHIVGICSLYGYSKYKSNQLRIAREEWKNKIEQRDNSNQSEWNTSSVSSKIITRPCPKIPVEVTQNAGPSILVEKTQELTKAFLTKANATINLTLKDMNKKEKSQVNKQLISSFSTINKKPDLQKIEKIVNKIATVPSEVRLNKPPIPVLAQAVPPSKKPVRVVSDYRPTSKPKPITNYTRSYQPQTNSQLKTYTEFDYETQETVQTFYSY